MCLAYLHLHELPSPSLLNAFQSPSYFIKAAIIIRPQAQLWTEIMLGGTHPAKLRCPFTYFESVVLE